MFKNGMITKILCLKVLTNYCININRVDKFDHNENMYYINRKIRKW